MNSRSKGIGGEREACEWLEQRIFGQVGIKRNLTQTRSGGADIIYHPLVIEVKRTKYNANLPFNKWWIQVTKAAKTKNSEQNIDTYIPIVMYRVDNMEWNFLIPATIIGCRNGWIHIDNIRFIQWMRQYIRIDT